MQIRQRYVEEESRSAGVRILIPAARIFINESAPSRICPGPLGWSQIRHCRCSLQQEQYHRHHTNTGGGGRGGGREDRPVRTAARLQVHCGGERRGGTSTFQFITPDRTPAVTLYNQSLPPPTPSALLSRDAKLTK